MSKSGKKPDAERQLSKDDSSFVSRWSRRKREVLDDDSPVEQDSGTKQGGPDIPLNSIVSDGVSGRMQTRTAADQLAEQRSRAKAGDDAGIEPLTDDDMPALDALDESSDYSGFMSSGVSDKLRKQALRKLFSSAGFNVRDGLDDYDDDFTNFEGLGDIITSDMKHRRELEAEKKEKAEELARQAEQEAEQQVEPADAQVTDSEPPDSAVSGQDELDENQDAEKTVKEPPQQSVTLAEDDPGPDEKPQPKKSH